MFKLFKFSFRFKVFVLFKKNSFKNKNLRIAGVTAGWGEVGWGEARGTEAASLRLSTTTRTIIPPTRTKKANPPPMAIALQNKNIFLEKN